jgi:hypothetical protein
MNHAITLGGLLLSIGVLGGILMVCFGLLSSFGNMMADAAGDGGKSGCIITAIGLVLLGGSVIGLLS